MDTCIWNDKIILASDISTSFELEKEIRLASGRKELICPDAQCKAVMIYRHGEKKEAHFAHLKNSNSCDYNDYDRCNNLYVKNVKSTLYYHFMSLGYDTKVDVKLLEHHYTHLTVSFDDGSIIAIELATKSASASYIDKLSKLYIDRNIIVKWLIIDNIEAVFKENQTYYIKRSRLNESSNKDLIVIDFNAQRVAQYKADSDKYQYNNFDYYPVSSQSLYRYEKDINQLIVLEKDITLIGFIESFQNWKAQKHAQLTSYIEQMKLEKKRIEELYKRRSVIENNNLKVKDELNKQSGIPKQKPHISKHYKTLSEEPFILEKITIPRTRTPVDKPMYFKWAEDDFKDKIKQAVDEDISALKMLISKVYECDEAELSIFISLLNLAKSAPQNSKTIKCVKIMEHVLIQTKRTMH